MSDDVDKVGVDGDAGFLCVDEVSCQLDVWWQRKVEQRSGSRWFVMVHVGSVAEM